MIEIKIDEYVYPENPEAPARRIVDVDKFIDGFNKLCNACNMHRITLGGFKDCQLPTMLNFDDGSSVGIMRLFKEIGFKNESS